MPSIKLTFIPQPHSRLLKSPTNTTCVGKLDGGVDVKQTNSANICVYLLPTQRVSESSRPRWACQVVGMFIVTCWSYNSITCSVSILLPWAPVQILQGQERQKWESRDQSYESPTFQISRYLNSVFYKKKLDADRLGRTCLKPFRLVPAAAGQNPGPFFLARCSFQHNLTGHHFTQRTQQTPARSDHVHWFQDRPAAFARPRGAEHGDKGGWSCWWILSAKLNVPADLPFTEKGARPLLCTARNRNQPCFPFTDVFQQTSILLRLKSLHHIPPYWRRRRALVYVGVHYRGWRHLQLKLRNVFTFIRSNTTAVNPLYFNIFLWMLTIPFKNFFKWEKWYCLICL